MATREEIDAYNIAHQTPTRSTSPMVIRGSTTYGDVIPNTAKASDIIQFGDRLSLESPEIQGLISKGYLAPYTDQGAIFTKAYTPTGMTTPNMRSMELNQGGTPFVPGSTPSTVSQNYQVRPIAPEVKKEYQTNLQHQLTALLGGANLPKGADLDYYMNAFTFGGYTAQDIANDWTEQQRGITGQTLGGRGRIVNPSVSRWHWIVGNNQPTTMGQEGQEVVKPETGVPSDVPPGTNVPRGTMPRISENAIQELINQGIKDPQKQLDYLNQFSGGEKFTMEDMPGWQGDLTRYLSEQGMGDLQIQDMPGMKLPDVIALSRQIVEDDDFLAAQLKSADEGYQALLSTINSNYANLRQETEFKSDTARGKQRAYLARLGALGNSVAAEGMLEGMRDQKDKAVDKIEQAKVAALASAFSAWQSGKTDLLMKAYGEAKKLAMDYTENVAKEWESKRAARQTGINEFTAKTNYLLGVYGKQLQQAGIQFDYDKLAQDADSFAIKMSLDQAEFEQRAAEAGDEAAREWAKITGYYVNEDGSLTPTADFMIDQMKLAQEDAKMAARRSGSGTSVPGYSQDIINEALDWYGQKTGYLPPSNKTQQASIVRQYLNAGMQLHENEGEHGLLTTKYRFGPYVPGSELPFYPSETVFDPYVKREQEEDFDPADT